MNLFEINAEIRRVLNELYESVDEETGEVDGDLSEVLSGLNNSLDEKLENITLYIKEKKIESEALKAEAKKLLQRAKTAENAVERLKDYLAYGMAESGRESFKTDRVQLSFRKSTSVVIDDIFLIPSEYLNQKVEANKTLIKEAYKKNIAPAGTHIEEKQSLIIK